MIAKRKVEVFTAGCVACDDSVAMVKRIACSSCDLEIHDMREPAAARMAKQYGLRRAPAVAINGKVVDCCANRGPDEGMLRAAGLGRA